MPHHLNQESHDGAHYVAPDATSKAKAQAEAKFRMYCLV
jgi:hypothetical protein